MSIEPKNAVVMTAAETGRINLFTFFFSRLDNSRDFSKLFKNLSFKKMKTNNVEMR